MPDLPENEKATGWHCPECKHPLTSGQVCNGPFTSRDHPPNVEPVRDQQPTPPNLAEKLRERATEGDYSEQGPLLWAADRIEEAIPSEVWGTFLSLLDFFAENAAEGLEIATGVTDYFSPEELLRLGDIATRLCPPEIAQQHGWEPRTTDKETT